MPNREAAIWHKLLFYCYLHYITKLQTHDKEDYRASGKHPVKLGDRSSRDIIVRTQASMATTIQRFYDNRSKPARTISTPIF